jgi:hypothetical protein
VQAKQNAQWLGGRRTGYALESAAPPRLMGLASGRWSALWSPLGSIQVPAARTADAARFRSDR